MKFLLTSAGIKNDSIRHALVDLLCKSQHYSAHGRFGGILLACMKRQIDLSWYSLFQKKPRGDCFVAKHEGVMEKTPLLPLPEGMLIDQIQITATGLMISVISTHPTSCCPLCSEPSSSIKSHYRRTLRDVPCGGRRVLLSLTVRKFYCRNA